MLLIILYFLKFYKKHKYVCKSKERNASVKFAVGMIVEIQSKNLIGVIIGWNKKKTLLINVCTKPIQNLYMVICTDNTLHYVPEGIDFIM